MAIASWWIKSRLWDASKANFNFDPDGVRRVFVFGEAILKQSVENEIIWLSDPRCGADESVELNLHLH